jgi:hypothetical protein
MYRYRQIKGMSDEEKADVVPRVIIFGGKAAPGKNSLLSYLLCSLLSEFNSQWTRTATNI